MTSELDDWLLTAELACLQPDEESRQRLAHEAERMKALFLTMSQADVDHLEPTTHALAGNNRVRNDAVEPFNNPDVLLEAAPEYEDEFFLIPNVL